MNLRNFQFLSLAITLTLFSAVDLLVTLVTPGTHHGWLVVPPMVAGIGVLFGFPFALSVYERLQDRIEKQVVELDTLHAMDTAILSEMELARVLDEAVKRVMGAVDAVAGGVVLFDVATGSERTMVVRTPDHTGEDADEFARIVRLGTEMPSTLWNAIVCPLRAEPVNASSGGGRSAIGYLATARTRTSRPFGENDAALVRAVAGTVVIAVTNADALETARRAAKLILDSERVQAALNRERRIAQALTEALLPDVAPQIGGFQVSKRYEAQSAEADVGGDIYDLFPLGPKRWGVVIADVSGKGLIAAQKTAMVKYSLRSYAREHASPALVLTRLNDTLADDDGMTGFVTLFYGVLDEVGCTMTYASAGHEPPVLRRSDGTFEHLKPTGMVLGAMRDMSYDEDVVELRLGDGLLLYTDGLTEARSVDAGDFLMIEGVEKILTELIDIPADALAGALWERVVQYTGNRQLDDTAILWIHHFCAA